MGRIAKLIQILKSLGVKKDFILYTEPESKVILIKTKRKPKIVKSFLRGLEIDLYDNQTFRVWSSKNKLSKIIASKYNLKLDLLNGECELYISISLADKLLPILGARVKNAISEERMVKLSQNLAKTPNLKKNKQKEAIFRPQVP